MVCLEVFGKSSNHPPVSWSKLIFCWKLISLDVDFIFGALRREGKNGTLIAFCSGTSLCDLGLQTYLVSALQGIC